MKNLSKKIGAGVVVSSLIVGGAVSTGLVANAYSPVQSQVVKSDKHEYENKFKKELEGINYRLGDLELFKAAKKMFNFGVFGYYLEDSGRMKHEIDDFLKDARVNIKDESKYEKIKNLLEKEILNNDQNHYDYAGGFLIDLFKHGMSKGIKKVQVGDAVAILFFENDVAPKPGYEENIYKWAEDWKGPAQVSDIEGRDHLAVFNQMLKFIEGNENLEANYLQQQ